MTSSAEPPSSKKQRTLPQYELIYHPGIPGRGEFVRLVFEAAGVSYTDVANEKEDGYASNQSIWDGSQKSVDGNPVAFAPPVLRVPGALGGVEDSETPRPLVISQTANILAYLGPKLGLSPNSADDEAAHFHISGLTMTALDLNDAAHDTHHPLDNTLVYEDQKETALQKARVFRNERLPKYFGYFERVLEGNKDKSSGKHIVGDALTYADTTLWHVLDGLKFAFPKEMAARESEYPTLLGVFYDGVRQEKGIKDYLASGRRLDYSMGIFRHYPELDRE